MRWFLGIGLVLLVALILQSGLLAYAMYVLLIMTVTSRLVARSWITKLTATRKCGKLIRQIGEKVKVEVTIRNAGRLPVPWALLEDMLPRYAVSQRFQRLKVIGKRI